MSCVKFIVAHRQFSEVLENIRQEQYICFDIQIVVVAKILYIKGLPHCLGVLVVGFRNVVALRLL